MWAQAADPMALITIGAVAGLMIGCVGVGGVIIVPILTLVLGIPTDTAAAAAMMGYVGTGVTGTLAFGRNRSIDVRLAGLLCLGAAPGALVGAWAVRRADPTVVQATIACLSGAAGIHTLLRYFGGLPTRRPGTFGAAGATATGCLVGFTSALTGTGGPLVLVPILIALGYPALLAVGLGQAIQLPVAITATLGAIYLGSFDHATALPVTAGLVLGSPAGAWISHRTGDAALRAATAVVLLGTSVIMLAMFAFRFHAA